MRIVFTLLVFSFFFGFGFGQKNIDVTKCLIPVGTLRQKFEHKTELAKQVALHDLLKPYGFRHNAYATDDMLVCKNDLKEMFFAWLGEGDSYLSYTMPSAKVSRFVNGYTKAVVNASVLVNVIYRDIPDKVMLSYYNYNGYYFWLMQYIEKTDDQLIQFTDPVAMF